MFTSSERTNAPGRVTSWRRSYLSRIPGANLGYFKEGTQNNSYKMFKVKWSNHKEEATWEKEDQLKAEFPDIFSNLSESRGQDSS
jgi:hypothetical protein